MLKSMRRILTLSGMRIRVNPGSCLSGSIRRPVPPRRSRSLPKISRGARSPRFPKPVLPPLTKNSTPGSKVSNTRTPSAGTHFPPRLKKFLPQC